MPFSLQEVAAHNSASSCWVIIKNKVYDVTDFLPEHPGGSRVILKYGGKDATSAYEPIHPPDTLENNLPKDKCLGELDGTAVTALQQQNESRLKTKDELRVERAHAAKPPLSRILNLQEIEDVARTVLPYKALAYYSSASDDELTYRENARALARFWFLPRVMRPTAQCDPSTTMLGIPSSIPVFVCPAALARLGHPLGEANITRGAARTSIIQMVSHNASLSPAAIAAARSSPAQPLFYQLYKHRDDATAAACVREVEALGYRAIVLTVDSPAPGNRERDIRAPFELEALERDDGDGDGDRTRQLKEPDMDEEGEDRVGGTAGALLAHDDMDLTWEKTIPWLRSVTTLPIVIKGIQCVADAVLAVEAGADAIFLSNHGGRQLEYALPPMEVLHRIRMERPDVFDKTEVYIDGGFRRGTDVLKALCLGARAVGLGRPFLYAQSAYGDAGVAKTVRILRREILTGMRLLGAPNVRALKPELIERVDWTAGAKL